MNPLGASDREGIMKIKVNLRKGRKVEASVGGHVVITDQPRDRGGDDTAPSPFLIFLASLATCTGYSIYDFCLTRDIPTANLQLVMRTERDDASRMVTRIEIEIQLPPEFRRSVKGLSSERWISARSKNT